MNRPQGYKTKRNDWLFADTGPQATIVNYYRPLSIFFVFVLVYYGLFQEMISVLKIHAEMVVHA